MDLHGRTTVVRVICAVCSCGPSSLARSMRGGLVVVLLKGI